MLPAGIRFESSVAVWGPTISDVDGDVRVAGDVDMVTRAGRRCRRRTRPAFAQVLQSDRVRVARARNPGSCVRRIEGQRGAPPLLMSNSSDGRRRAGHASPHRSREGSASPQDHSAVKNDIAGGEPPLVLRRGVDSQHLLDRTRDQARVGEPPAPTGRELW